MESKSNPTSAEMIERAHLHYLRGELTEAREVLEAVLAQEPNNMDAHALLSSLLRGKKSTPSHGFYQNTTVQKLRQWVFVGVGYACFLVALYLFFDSFGSKYHPKTAGPIIAGMRLLYWRLLGAVLLTVAGLVLLYAGGRFEPDWRDLDKPDLKGPPYNIPHV